MMNVLIPTDFSQNAWNAIEYACDFFSNSPCNFYLLHINTPNTSVKPEATNDIEGDLGLDVLVKSPKKRLQETLQRINKSLPLNGNQRFFTITDQGYMIDSIRRQVVDKKIDFIAMGTKGASGYKKNNIGTNTGNVITKVMCNTLVIPENAKYTKLSEIAFPTDFHFFYLTETLKPFSDIIKRNNSATRVLYIDKKGGELNSDQKANKEFLVDYLSEHEHSFHFLANKNIEEGVENFVEMNKINLITMLAKNLNYFQKILFHPTMPKISYYTKVPFLILH
ncbi:universal stress protein [Pseudalgibacter alginicilyticus]|uniref:Universal stress protein n=1 Tax=Pseudalgibacter alginicilyticus TaxID=1736674 RepID=A0A0P0DAH7_9FLAO|nr:universal stress protein [Pseudalgibacter alginicilyticus]ALJ05043.1 universal stress protein [Pseudalgibacter alginicilyticus]